MSGNFLARGGFLAAIGFIIILMTGLSADAKPTTGAPDALLGQPYFFTMSTSTDNTPPISVEVVDGVLPPGLSLAVTGPRSAAISGTPTTEGTYLVQIMVEDSDPVIVVPDYMWVMIDVNPPPGPVVPDISVTVKAGESVTIDTAADLNPADDIQYATVVSPPSQGAATPGGTEITYTADSDADGTDTFEFTVTDSHDQESNVATVTVEIERADTDVTIRLPSTGPLTGKVGEDFSESFPATGGTEPYDYTVTDGTLPPGLHLDGDTISGTPTEEGTSTITLQATDRDGNTGDGSYTIVIGPADSVRADPSEDPDVLGLLTAQQETAIQFAGDQITTITGRLERLRHEDYCERESSIDLRIAHADRDTDPGDPSKDSVNLSGKTFQSCNLAIWGAGYLSLADYDRGGIDFSSTGVGLTVGADYRFSPSFVGGVAVGYGRSHSGIGTNGTEMIAKAVSAALYGSWHKEGWYLDGLLGYQRLRFDNTRYVTANGDTAYGSRSGDQVFGALLGGYEFREDDYLVAPYVGIRGSSGTLHRYSETGGGIYGLTYGDQRVSSTSGVVGVRAEKEIELETVKITPSARVEYRHDFSGRSDVSIGYTDTGTQPFNATVPGTGRDSLTLGVGLRVDPKDSDWTIEGTLSSTFGNGKPSAYAGMRATFRF